MQIELPRTGNLRSFDDARRDDRCTTEAQRAIDVLARYLGDHWPGWEQGRPLANSFFVTFQHSEMTDGVRFARLVAELEPKVDREFFGSFLRRLLGSSEWHDYFAADTALSFLASHARVRIPVEFVAEGSTPTPDARVTMADRPITVEFKGMFLPDSEKKFADFFKCLLEHQIDVNALEGEILETPSEAAYESVATAIAEFVADGAVGVLSFDEGWVRKRSEGMLWGPSGKNDFERLKSRLSGQQYTRQLLETETPNVLLVRTRTAFLGVKGPRLAEQTELLKSQLEKRPEVSAIVIAEACDASPIFCRDESIRLFVDEEPEFRTKRAVLAIANRQAVRPVTQEELDALVGPQMRW